jgi:hypothetical protein
MTDPRTSASKLVEAFHAPFGGGLRSAVLFGSVARGEAVPGVSDVNVLLLVDALGPPELAGAAPVVREWIRKGHTPPQLHLTEEWESGKDSFAIELADMEDAREVLHGEDPVTPGAVRLEHLRSHAEQELRRMLLQFRVRTVVGAGQPGELGRLLLSGLPSFTAYMRAALRLAGESPGLDTPAVIRAAGTRIGADPSPVLSAWAARARREHLEVSVADPVFQGYDRFNRVLLRFIDGIDPGSPVGSAAPTVSAPTGPASRRDG